MKKIMMHVTRQGSQHGYDVETFEKGHVYTVTDSLADSFINDDVAIAVTEPDLKDQGGAAENKDQGAPDENKGGLEFIEVNNNPDAGKGEGVKLWTYDELKDMKMDDIRKIGDPLGAKDTNKKELIIEILKAQKKNKPGFGANLLNKIVGKK